jgi:hypothetical protein
LHNGRTTRREETAMSDSADFTKLVPGFDFLQNLVKTAGATLPNVGQWVAPTLDPDEIDKRIGELRTVQFWLEQNVRMLGTTIQALEVQRMTLSTLQTMNVQMTDLREALTIRLPTASEPPAARSAASVPPAPASPATPPPAAVVPPVPAEAAEAAAATTAAPPPAAAPTAAVAGAVDPMQWWAALTRQFTEIATNAIRESTAEGNRPAAGAAPAADAPRTPAAKRKRPAAKKARPRRRPAGA